VAWMGANLDGLLYSLDFFRCLRLQHPDSIDSWLQKNTVEKRNFFVFNKHKIVLLICHLTYHKRYVDITKIIIVFFNSRQCNYHTLINSGKFFF